MRRSTAVLDRLVAGLLGALLIVAGLLGIAAKYELMPFAAWTDGFRPSRLPGHVDQDWFTWALAVAAILGVVLALALFAANIDRRLTRTKIDENSDDTGEIRFHLADVADAVAKRLQSHDGIRRARGRAEVDRGSEAITINLDLAHDAEIASITRLCDETADDIDAALGDVDCGTRFLLHIGRPPNG